jgi:hypothetical protein
MAAQSSPFRCFFLVFLYINLFFNCNVNWANLVYSRQDLIRIGFRAEQAVNKDFIYSNGIRCSVPVTDYFKQTHNIPHEISRTPGSPWIVVGSQKLRRRRRNRKQKRGCRAGLLTRLKKHPHKPPLPSVFLANVRSIVPKLDDLELRIATDNFRDCCVMILTETWLHPAIPDNAVQLAGRTIH